MVVKLSANTLSWSQQFGEGKMTLLDMIEECYKLRLDGVSPAQPHFASTGQCPAQQPRAPPRPPLRRFTSTPHHK